GFEGETWQSAIKCATATANSCVDSNPWNAWTANFMAGATVEVISGAAKGQTATVTSNTISDYEAGNTSNPTHGVTLSFSPLSTPMADGDWLIVRTTIPGNAQAGWWTSTSGGGSLSTDFNDLASDSPGRQALMLSASGSGQSAGVQENFDSWSGRSFIQLKGTYTLVFKAKGMGGNNSLSLNVVRLATSHGNETFLNQNVALTSDWKDYSYTFNANEDGTYIGPVSVSFTASGSSAYLDDVELDEAPAADNPTAYRNAVVDTLRQLQPGVIRYMDGTDFGSSIANAVAPPFARQRAGVNGSAEQDDAPMGLEEFLVLCQAVGAEPWYTMAGGATVTDMQNLVEFLGGSTSTPFGAQRAALGQTAPWTSVFPKIHIELGNEMWNSVMAGEAITDPYVYGSRAGLLFTAAKNSPSYSPVLDLVMGSIGVNAWYTQTEMANSSNFDSVDAAPYLYYSLSDYSSNEAIFGPMFAQPEQIDEPSSTSGNYMAQQAAAAAGGSSPVNLNVYEVNLSTVGGTAPQDTVNQVVAGVGAGITVADHMLLMMRDLGITTQNMFALSEYQNNFNNSATGASESTPLWGSVIDMGGATNLKRPQFLAEELANSAILPAMLQVKVTGANPTWNQPQSANDNLTPIQLANAHYLQSFAFTDGTKNSVVVFNLSRSGSLPVTFSGANAPAGNVTVSQLTSQNPTDNNENLPAVNITHNNLSGFNGATAYQLPPFSMTVFSWSGSSSLSSTSTQLTASPTQGAAGQTITLTATVSSQSSSTPGGTVTFLDNGAGIGAAQLDANGTASMTATSLPSGTNSITASYGGDSANAGSTSSAVAVTLTAAPASSSTSNSSSGTSTSTSTSSPSTGSTSGTSTSGTSTSGTSTSGTSTSGASTSGTSTSGTSTGATAPALTSTITTLHVAQSQVAAGEPIKIVVRVRPLNGGAIPTGTVTLSKGGASWGSAPLNDNGTAYLRRKIYQAGSYEITASYSGSTTELTSTSTPATITIQ
ncbi:MAG TPA: Ig-like domain repeat protein, partial [Acidobacteriaceae bacterium]|nr:Ig-like domain repeat protein [Acidobacteriaceae bacterium]